MMKAFFDDSFYNLGGLVCLVLLAVVLTSCSGSEKRVDNGESDAPEWVYGFVDSAGTCGVGVSKPHMKGYSFQRITAISRAIDEIARQKSVKVSTTLESMMKKVGNSGSSDLKTYSVQTTSGETISAKIIGMWKNKVSSEFFVKLCTS